jgi:hypothetical protein
VAARLEVTKLPVMHPRRPARHPCASFVFVVSKPGRGGCGPGGHGEPLRNEVVVKETRGTRTGELGIEHKSASASRPDQHGSPCDLRLGS